MGILVERVGCSSPRSPVRSLSRLGSIRESRWCKAGEFLASGVWAIELSPSTVNMLVVYVREDVSNPVKDLHQTQPAATKLKNAKRSE